MNEAHQALLDEFVDQLWLEEGLARNTLESYRRDLAQMAFWLESRRSGLLRPIAPTSSNTLHAKARYPSRAASVD